MLITEKLTKNKKLNLAKHKKDDEFYTQYEDIKIEMEVHKDKLKDKIIYCPCDNYEKSQFVKFFLEVFDEYELKGLIATSYEMISEKEPNLFNGAEIKKGKVLSKIRGREITYGFLGGSGDFRSTECKKYLDKADIVITNPPFSLFREFFNWSKEKDVILVSPLGCIGYSEIFPYIKSRKLIVGKRLKEFNKPEGKKSKVPSIWLSTFNPPKIDKLILTENYSPEKYPKYDNYDAINVDKTKEIPCDYFGIMGVPMTFLEKWNPEQFEVLGMSDRLGSSGLRIKKYIEQDSPLFNDLNATTVFKNKKGEYEMGYRRIFVKQRYDAPYLDKKECILEYS